MEWFCLYFSFIFILCNYHLWLDLIKKLRCYVHDVPFQISILHTLFVHNQVLGVECCRMSDLSLIYRESLIKESPCGLRRYWVAPGRHVLGG